MVNQSLLVDGTVETPDPPAPTLSAPGGPKQGMDFWINDLWFKVDATSTDPYQRATAQFRKDQLDNAAGFGDASLVGYWTRGQFSFHAGEGIRYYDVIGSQTLRVQQDDSQVLNRYWDGGGIDPFTPGSVTLMGLPTAYAATYTHLTYAGWVGTKLLVVDNGVAKYGNGTTMTTIGAPTTTTAACTSATTAFIATMNAGTAQIETLDLGTGTRVVLYTNGTNQINYLFYAKDRLWAIDSTQTVYQLAPNPSGALPITITGTSKVFQASTTAANSQWSVADTPGAVMLSNNNLIYAATPDTSGTIPVMNYPFVAATLPIGESVYGMAYSLNGLVLATSAGVRVAVLTGQSSNGLAYGPLLMKVAGTGGTTTITGVAGSTVFAVVGGKAYRVNLAQQVGTTGLEYAYTRIGDQAVTYAGSAITTTNYALFSTTTLYQIAASGGPLASGFIETGFHRFQTLENKKFQTVQVRAKGTGGTITISYQLPNGTTNPLYTMDLSQQQSVKLNLNLTQPQEMVGFRFDISPSAGDNTVGPTLLGYQVQALPAPTRNRMIRVPLMCFDIERREASPAVGHTGFA